MSVQIEPITHRLGTLEGYGFHQGKMQKGYVQQDSSHLQNCFIATVGDSTLVRTGCIDTPQKAEEFFQVMKMIGIGRIASSHQLAFPRKEWGAVEAQHAVLQKYSFTHFNIPIDHLYLPEQEEQRLLLGEEKALLRLPKLQNMEGWATYCAWLNEEVEATVESFPFDALDEYQLEAKLKDFSHEVHSVFLRDMREIIDKVLSQVGELEAEKQLIAAREKLQKFMRTQYERLDSIEKGIAKIDHPELLPLQQKVTMLKDLIGDQAEVANIDPMSWEKQALLSELLNHELGITSAINCDNGWERTSFVFSLRLSLLQLRKERSVADLMKAIHMWDDDPMISQLREHTFKNYTLFSLPIIKLNPSLQGEGELNPELLHCFPPENRNHPYLFDF